jgi:transglycosylase-like protein with SLT domain
MDHAKDPQQHPTADPHASEPDRRQAERRHAERRLLMSFGGRRLREDRRKRDRRLKLAGAGLLAAAALAAGGHEVLSRMGAPSLGIGLPGQEPSASVDVNTDFHLPSWDKAALEPFIQEAAALHNLPAALIRAVIQQESRFNPLAVSRVGAQGLMQLMPETARHVGIENPFDPRENILGGTKYLRSLLERFNGNTAKAVAAYNAGPTVVSRRGGIPPFRETQGYVRNIQKMVAGTDAAFSMPAAKVRKASLRTAGGGAHKGARVHGRSKSVVRKASTMRRPLVRKASMRATRARRGSRV